MRSPSKPTFFLIWSTVWRVLHFRYASLTPDSEQKGLNFANWVKLRRVNFAGCSIAVQWLQSKIASQRFGVGFPTQNFGVSFPSQRFDICFRIAGARRLLQGVSRLQFDGSRHRNCRVQRTGVRSSSRSPDHDAPTRKSHVNSTRIGQGQIHVYGR